MKTCKTALITGVTGQDGSYLAEFLLEKNYRVHGIVRPSSHGDIRNIAHLKDSISLYHGDLCDTGSLYEIFSKCQPCEVYNLAAQSHVGVSFENPVYTADVNALGTLRLLELVRQSGRKDVRFYQASTSELFGEVAEMPQSEATPFRPQSPYAIAKQFAYWIVKNYREAHGMYACNGILFNHESPRRGHDFVTQKIVRGLCDWSRGSGHPLVLGNLEAKRDWGHARDYVEMQWRILQHATPEDFVIATGCQITVRDFVNLVAKKLDIQLNWSGKGLDEVAVSQTGEVVVSVSEKYFRPTEVNTLLGDISKASSNLGWKATTNVNQLAAEMVEAELSRSLKG